MASRPLPVYLVHYDEPQWCASAIESLRRSEGDLRLAVIDNGPDHAALAAVLPEGVRHLPQPHNSGYAGGANAAIADWRQTYLNDSYLVVGSHDLHVAPDCLARLVGEAERCPSAGIVAPLLTAPVERSGGTWTGVRSIQVRPDHPLPPLSERDWASGTCLLLRREMLDDVGGFDESFGSYVEDVDIGLRARDHGWRVVVVNEAHAHGLGTSSSRSIELITANTVLLNAKRRGWVGLAHSAALFAWWGTRSVVSSVAPWRDRARRDEARVYARGRWRGLSRALRPASLRVALGAHR